MRQKLSSLSKKASKITSFEIIKAVESEMAHNKCLIDKEFCSDQIII
jgi:DNA-binding IscR family transcriptional regulator